MNMKIATIAAIMIASPAMAGQSNGIPVPLTGPYGAPAVTRDVRPPDAFLGQYGGGSALAEELKAAPVAQGDCWAAFKREYDQLVEQHNRASYSARQAALDGHSAAAQIYGNTAMELMREAAAVRLAALQKCN